MAKTFVVAQRSMRTTKFSVPQNFHGVQYAPSLYIHVMTKYGETEVNCYVQVIQLIM